MKRRGPATLVNDILAIRGAFPPIYTQAEKRSDRAKLHTWSAAMLDARRREKRLEIARALDSLELIDEEIERRGSDNPGPSA